MKKYLKPILALVLVVALAIGGTLAYLTDVTEEKKNEFTVKDVDIELTESYNTYTLTPGKEFTKDPTITVIKDESYVFTDVIETIPTVALGENAKEFTFANYVTYKVNETKGGEVYLGGGETATAWKWTKIDEKPSEEDGITTNTYTYALTDMDDNLLVVSSLDKMLDESGNKVDAKYPILEGDKASVPTTLTQEMIDLFPENTATTVSVDLTFQGFAIQTDGLDDLTTDIAKYEAAKGSAPTTVS